MLYFHGNAEDIGLSYDFVYDLREEFKINVVAIEYPGYGVYKDCQTSAQ